MDAKIRHIFLNHSFEKMKITHSVYPGCKFMIPNNFYPKNPNFDVLGHKALHGLDITDLEIFFKGLL